MARILYHGFEILHGILLTKITWRLEEGQNADMHRNVSEDRHRRQRNSPSLFIKGNQVDPMEL